MKLIKPSYEIITPINGEEILKQIELAARTCYKSEDKIEYVEDNRITPGEGFDKVLTYSKSARPLIQKLISLGHEAMLEFGGMINVKFVCDRGVSHELVRHRVASFAQESTRYCNYGKDEHITFILPNWFSNMENNQVIIMKDYDINDEGICFINGNGNDINMSLEHADETLWLISMATSEHNYNRLLKVHNWTPQQARSVLPNSLKTEINVSANIREWRHILCLRTAKAAHPQMRELMCPLLDEFKSKIPILFDDINY